MTGQSPKVRMTEEQVAAKHKADGREIDNDPSRSSHRFRYGPSGRGALNSLLGTLKRVRDQQGWGL